jgi:hypothetical protein
MVFLKALGILDFLAGISLVFLKFGLLENIALILGIYLIVKSIIFIKSLASIFDLISGILIVLAAHGMFFPFTWLVAVWLLQKGIFSLF